MNSREKMDGERSLGEQEKKIRPQQRRVSPKWHDMFPSLANRPGSVSEEGVAIRGMAKSCHRAMAADRRARIALSV